jgi:hypothetical protein
MGEILSALNAEQASKQVQHLIDELEDIRYRKRATERQSIENHLDQTPQKRPDFPPRISSVERSASTDGNITFVTIIDYRRLIEVSDEGDVFRFSKRQGSSPGEYQVAVARRSSNGHAISAFLLSIELGETALLCTSTGKHIRLVGERDGVRVADASGPGYDQLFRSLKTARAKSDDIAQYAEGVGAKWIDLTKEIQIQGEDDVVDLGGNSTPSTYALLGIAPYGMGRYTRYGYLVPVGREVLVNPVEGGPRRLVAFNGSIQIKEASGPSYWELLKEQVEKLRTRRSLERAMKRASRLAALKRTEPTE